MISKKIVYICACVFLVGLGCNNSVENPSFTPSAPSVPGAPGIYAESGKGVSLGPPCRNKGTKSYCVNLKYVVYQDTDGKSVVSKKTVQSNLETINRLWSQCEIQFQISQYLSVDPSQYGLAFNPADDSELNPIRKAFKDQHSFLVVTTGKWDRSGTLGNTGANAWTSMPGEDYYGSILEDTVGDFGNIIAHELGHYMGLDHYSDTTNLMNPIIYDSSTNLTDDQCSDARSTLKDFWELKAGA